MNRLLAQIVNPAIPSTIGSGGIEKGGIITGAFVSSLISVMFLIAFIVAFFFLITGGFFWITSGGDKGNLESARNKILHSIVGLIVVASTWAVMNLVAQFIGWEDFSKLPLPSIPSVIQQQQIRNADPALNSTNSTSPNSQSQQAPRQ